MNEKERKFKVSEKEIKSEIVKFKGMEFVIEYKEITDYEEFEKKEDLISELSKLINEDYNNWRLSIGFGISGVFGIELLKCNGQFLSFSKKELKSELTIFKGKLTRILEKYYGKIKPEVTMELFFDKL